VAARPAPADATAARPSIRLEPLPIAMLKTYKGHASNLEGHALSWPPDCSLENNWKATLRRGRPSRAGGRDRNASLQTSIWWGP